MVRDAAYWINHLKLEKHVEGGSFRETYRSSMMLPATALNGAFTESKTASTAIYFLLESGQFSAFHTIKSDEVWHFYDGDPLDIFEILHDGTLFTHKLGRDPEKGQALQAVVKAGNWFGSRVAMGGSFSLVGCTVAPGFDFADFELATHEKLGTIYPAHKSLIRELTYS